MTPEDMDHLRRRVEALEKMLCQGHPAGVVCGVCRPEPRLRTEEEKTMTDVQTDPALAHLIKAVRKHQEAMLVVKEMLANQQQQMQRIEARLDDLSAPEPPGCPACDGVFGTACRCPEPQTGAPLMAWAEEMDGEL